MIPRYLGALFLGGGGNIFGIDVCLPWFTSPSRLSAPKLGSLGSAARRTTATRNLVFAQRLLHDRPQLAQNTLEVGPRPVSPTRGDPSVEPLRHCVWRFTTQRTLSYLARPGTIQALVPKGMEMKEQVSIWLARTGKRQCADQSLGPASEWKSSSGITSTAST